MSNVTDTANKSQGLRVLYFIGSYSPDLMGNSEHEQTLVAMRARGHDVEVFTTVNDPGKPRRSRAVYRGVPVHRLNLAAHRRGLAGLARKVSSRVLQYEYVPALLPELRRVLRAGRYDLVHAEGAYPFGFIAALACGRIPYVASVQGADVIDLPEADYGYRRFKIPRTAVQFALRRAAVVRVKSPLMTRYLVDEHIVEASHIMVVPRVLEGSAFPAVPIGEYKDASRRLLMEKYGVGLGRPVVISLSRLHPFKGIEYLVDAIPEVVRTLTGRGMEPPWFLICGPSRTTESFGDYREFLQKRAEAAGVAQHIVFTGQVAHSEVAQHLAGADVLAVTSIYEALNMVALEAAAVGTPSVITDTTGITAFLAPRGACVPVPPKSAEAIAYAIVHLLTDEEFYGEVQKNAALVAGGFRASQVAPLLEVAWRRAARRKS